MNREEAVEAMLSAYSKAMGEPMRDSMESAERDMGTVFDALAPFVVFRSELERLGWLIPEGEESNLAMIDNEPYFGDERDEAVYRIREED